MSFRLAVGNMVFLLSLDGDLGICLQWQQGSQDSSRVEVGKSCFLLSCSRGIRPHLLSSCSRNKGFFSSGCWIFRVFWRVATVPGTSARSAARNLFLWICSTGCRIALASWWESWGSRQAWLLLRVPGNLQWGVLPSFLGATHL